MQRPASGRRCIGKALGGRGSRPHVDSGLHATGWHTCIMMRSTWHTWASMALVGLGSGIVSCLLTTWIVAGGPVSMSPGSGPQFDGAFWMRRLDELGNRIEAGLAEIPGRIVSTHPVRTEVNASTTSSISPQMDRLEERIGQALQALASGQGRDVALPRWQPPRQSELDSLHALDRQDRDAARRSTMLLTAVEVAARFGFPDEVGGATGGGVFWQYYHRGLTGERDGGTSFVFRDGRVVWHDISIPNR